MAPISAATRLPRTPTTCCTHRQIAQARADAERLTIDAEARAKAEAIRITTVAQANAESIQKVNEAIKAGGDSYFRYRQIEMIPEIAPMIAEALSKARLVTISGDSAEGGAAQSATSNITSVIQTVLAAQLVSSSGMLQSERDDGRHREGERTAVGCRAPAGPPGAETSSEDWPVNSGVLPEALQNSTQTRAPGDRAFDCKSLLIRRLRVWQRSGPVRAFRRTHAA